MGEKEIAMAANPRKPVEAVRGIDKVQAIIGEKSLVKWAWIGPNEKPRWILIFPFVLKLSAEIRESFEDGIEIVGRKVVQIDAELRRRLEMTGA